MFLWLAFCYFVIDDLVLLPCSFSILVICVNLGADYFYFGFCFDALVLWMFAYCWLSLRRWFVLLVCFVAGCFAGVFPA